MNSDEMNLVKREQWISYFRAIGIILMVFGHSGASETMRNFIYLFHMPLFFFISGYLYKDNLSLLKFIKKKIKTLYFPFVFWQIVFIFLNNIFVKTNIYSIDKIISSKEMIFRIINVITFGGKEQMGGAMWFLPALFWVNIIYYLIIRLSNIWSERYRKYIIFIIVIMCFFIGYNTDFPRFISVSLVAILIFYLGYMYKFIENKFEINWIIAVLAFGILIIMNKYGYVRMNLNEYYSALFFIVSSVLGIAMIIFMSKFLESNLKEIKVLKDIGENTLYIMILHFLSFKIVSFIIIKWYDYAICKLSSFPVIKINQMWSVLYTLSGIFIPLLYIKFIRRFKRRR